jgi:hypothetical protein
MQPRAALLRRIQQGREFAKIFFIKSLTLFALCASAVRRI